MKLGTFGGSHIPSTRLHWQRNESSIAKDWGYHIAYASVKLIIETAVNDL
jgi:hypothetical protein